MVKHQNECYKFNLALSGGFINVVPNGVTGIKSVGFRSQNEWSMGLQYCPFCGKKFKEVEL